MMFPAHRDSRMYRLLLLSLLCVMTYRAEGFVTPQSPRFISIQLPFSPSPRGALNLDQQLAQEHRSPRDMSDSIKSGKSEAWPKFPLFLLASLSTIMKTSNRNGNPLLFASTLSNPASQAPFRWALALGLILMQSYGATLFKIMAIMLQQFFCLLHDQSSCISLCHQSDQRRYYWNLW